MVLVHDDDLKGIDGIGDSTVSGRFIGGFVVFLIIVVTGKFPTRHGD
jgi:hypothetical protein